MKYQTMKGKNKMNNETYEKNTSNLDEHLQSFFKGCQAIYNKGSIESIERFNQSNPGKTPLPLNFHDKEWSLSIGKRYAKIICEGSAFCFVDLTTGDVLKSASWSAPAKGSRGNIFDIHNGLKRIRRYGPEYNR